MNDPLYADLILDHNKNPRHWGTLPVPAQHLTGHNPLCGDRYELYLQISGENILEKIKFSGSGCAISKASGSLMCQLLENKTKTEALELFRLFSEQLKGHSLSPENLKTLGKLQVFSGIKNYPARVKCANLVWHTLANLLKQQNQPTTTE